MLYYSLSSIILLDSAPSSIINTILNLLIWAVIIGAIYYSIQQNSKFKRQKREQYEALEREYKDALKGYDKAKALELGRLYYGSKRRGGVLTIYDEQALTNDLSTMS